MDTTQLVRQATPIGYSSLARGHVWGGENHPQAAPTTFTERVWVILPEGSSEHLYGPCKWLAGHGTTKPQPGAECVVGFDEQNQPTIVWWEGAQTEPTLELGAEQVTEANIKAKAVSEAKLATTVAEHLLASERVTTEFLKKEAVTEAKLEKALQERVTQDSGWKAPTLGASWKNVGGENMTCAYRKQGNVVRLRGIIEGGANESSPFTLPEGFRPTATISPAAGTSTLGKAARLVITSAGVIKVFYEAGIVSLDSVTFTID